MRNAATCEKIQGLTFLTSAIGKCFFISLLSDQRTSLPKGYMLKRLIYSSQINPLLLPNGLTYPIPCGEVVEGGGEDRARGEKRKAKLTLGSQQRCCVLD